MKEEGEGTNEATRYERRTIPVYCCTACDGVFKHKDGIENHVKDHYYTGEHDYREAAKADENTGETDRGWRRDSIYVCEICEMTFIRKKDVERHVDKGCNRDEIIQTLKCSIKRRGEEGESEETYSNDVQDNANDSVCEGQLGFGDDYDEDDVCDVGYSDDVNDVEGDVGYSDDVTAEYDWTPNNDGNLVVESENDDVAEKAKKFFLKTRTHSSNVSKPYQCNECGSSYNCRSGLCEHWKMKHNPHAIEYTCNLCPYSSLSKPALTKHMKTHVTTKPFSCDECNSMYSTKHTLWYHKQIKHRTGPLPYSCPECPYETCLKIALTKHMKSHTTISTSLKQWTCDLCAEQFENKQHLIFHKRSHIQNPPQFKCNICPFSSYFKDRLTTHMKIHSNNKPFVCDVCGASYRYKSALQMHVEAKHNASKIEYSCKSCPYVTSISEYFKGHLRKHMEDSYQCGECEDRFKSSKALQIHVNRVHIVGPPQYQCERCSYITHDRRNLNKHHLTHSDERRYKCDECCRAYKQRDGLRMHKLTYHCEAKSYLCNECGRSFGRNSSFRRHQTSHHGSKTYPCHLCDKSYTQKGNLTKHISTAHEKKRDVLLCDQCEFRCAHISVLRKHQERMHVFMSLVSPVLDL